MNPRKYKKNKRGRHTILTGFAVLVAMAGASYAIAWAWHNMEQGVSAAENGFVVQQHDSTRVAAASPDAGSQPEAVGNPVQAPSTPESQHENGNASGSSGTGREGNPPPPKAASDLTDISGMAATPAESAPEDGTTDGNSEAQAPAGIPAGEAEEPTDAAAQEAPVTAIDRSGFYFSVSEGARVPESYFDDAIFFGDSLSTGIPLYKMTSAPVLAFTSINTLNVNTKEVIEVGEGKRKTLLDAAKDYGERRKVYIMLGSNGLGYEKDVFIDGYRKFLRAVKEQYPDAIIYVQSMTPVTDKAVKLYPSATNDRIEEYNLAIQDLAREQGVYFLDVASCMINADGKLPDDASPLDGLHFTPEYYAKWFEYLKTHTVGG